MKSDRENRPSLRLTAGLVKLAPFEMSGPESWVNFQSVSEGEERVARKFTPLAVGLLASRIAWRRTSGLYQLVASEYASLPSSSKLPDLYSNFGKTVSDSPSFETATGFATTLAPVVVVKLTNGSVPTTVLRAPVLKVTVRCGVQRSV